MSESSPLDVISRDESSEDPLQSQTFTLSMKTGKPLDLPRFPVFEFYRIPQIGSSSSCLSISTRELQFITFTVKERLCLLICEGCLLFCF